MVEIPPMGTEKEEREKEEGKSKKEHLPNRSPEEFVTDITKEEEKFFLFYYQVKMLEICEDLFTPIQIQSTAITYFKLVFSKRRIFHYDMDNLVVACILLAMKVENIFITAVRINEKLKFTDVNLLAAYELEICNLLKFNLHVPSPHLRLLGLFLLLKNKERNSLIQTQEITETDETLDWNESIRNLKYLMLLEEYHTLDLNHVAIASLPVGPSSLEGLFMEDTLEAVKFLKKKMKKKEKPAKKEISFIKKKIEKIQQLYKIDLS